MKGIVFNLLGEVIAEEHGEPAWDDLLATCGLAGSYTSLGNYSDEEFRGLVGAAARTWQRSPDDVLRWFGRRAMPKLAAYRPAFFERHQSAESFVLTVNTIIHPEVRKLYPGADVPEFDFSTSNGVLLMGYHSPRKLCALAKGFVEGAADYFHEEARIEEPQCMHHGHEQCLMQITFAPQS